MPKQPSGSGEDELIARHFKPLADHPGAFGLEDDAASLTPPAGCDLVVTSDALVAGVHFFSDDPPETVGKKALRVNLSDLAAKGARPQGFLLALALPSDFSESWVSGFASGLGDDAHAYNCPLLGGDTVHTPGPTMICISAFGAVKQGQMVHRAGARPGDLVVVTGTLGDAALGLLLRKDPGRGAHLRLLPHQQDELKRRYLQPQPRSAIADLLPGHVSAAMDVSDGLAGDLAKLCRASNVAAEIEAARVPLSEAARAAVAADPALLDNVLTGGDDYEILSSVPASRFESLQHAAAGRDVSVTQIGRIAAGSGLRLLDKAGHLMSLTRLSFSHF